MDDLVVQLGDHEPQAVTAPTTPTPDVPMHQKVLPASWAPVAPRDPASKSRGRIPSGVTFKGNITGKDPYEIHGTIEGSIKLEGADLAVMPGASFSGNLVAKDAVIAGKVSGQIDCPDGCVTFEATARCDASLAYGELVVERGAKVNAQLRSSGE